MAPKLSGDVRGASQTRSSPAALRLDVPVLLQHLASRLGQLCGEEAAGGERAGGEQDGYGLGDADERLEDADAQHGCHFTEGVQEAERRGPEGKQRNLNLSMEIFTLTSASVPTLVLLLIFGLLLCGPAMDVQPIKRVSHPSNSDW